jgi:cobalamin-dependent methionine synthase I
LLLVETGESLMAISGLTIIGESLNDSVPSTHKLYESGDFQGIRELVRFQDEGGANWIDVNVGLRSPEFMAQVVREAQSVTGKPLSIDTPDPVLAEAGLRVYDASLAGGKLPILNSISLMRADMFDLREIQPFMPILLTFERNEGGVSRPNRNSEENYAAAKDLLALANERGIPTSDCIFDPGVAPIGSDTDGILKMVLETMRLIHEESGFSGCHVSVGLSNFTVMLPVKRADGSLVKGPLESAFLTRATPLGLDFVIGSVKRNYQILEEDHPAMACLRDVLSRDGFDCVMRVMEYYS